MRERSWQLMMSGHGLERITVEARLDMERLLDLMPSITHLTIEIGEIGEDRIHVARDWPSSRTEEADRLLRRIAGSGGVSAIIIPGAADEPAKRVVATG